MHMNPVFGYLKRYSCMTGSNCWKKNRYRLIFFLNLAKKKKNPPGRFRVFFFFFCLGSWGRWEEGKSISNLQSKLEHQEPMIVDLFSDFIRTKSPFLWGGGKGIYLMERKDIKKKSKITYNWLHRSTTHETLNS